MKGTKYTGLPLGYVTAVEAIAILGVSQDTVYRLKYLDAIDSWQPGKRNPRLFKKLDVENLAIWISHCKKVGRDWRQAENLSHAMQLMEWDEGVESARILTNRPPTGCG